MREITLNGINYPINFSVMALRQLQKELNVDTVEEIFEKITKGFNLDALTIMFWLGLKSCRKNTTFERACEIIDTAQDGEFVAQIGAMAEELTASFNRLVKVEDEGSEENSKNTVNPA